MMSRKLPIGIQSFEKIRNGNYLYIDFNLVTSGTIFLEDCWSRGGFLTWFNMVKGGGVGSTREIMAILLFKNNYGRIVYRKVLRVRYFRL